MFLPSFGNSVMIDSLCDGGISPFTQLNFHALRIIGPAILQSFLYTLYVIPSDPGAESEHVFRAARSSASVNSVSSLSLDVCDSLGQLS